MSRTQHPEDNHLTDVIGIHCGVTGRGHRAKGVRITTFRYQDPGWSEIVSGPWRQKHLTDYESGVPDSGVTLAGDRHADWQRLTGDDADDYRRTLRNVYTLACPVCAPERTPAARRTRAGGGETLELRQEVLFEALDRARHAGLAFVTLPMLRAIVHDIAQGA